MKKRIFILSALFFLLVENGLAQSVCYPTSNAHASVRYRIDYSPLSFYGEWIEIAPNRTVWRPLYISAQWRPYSVGSWIWTDYGWYWESYEPFGEIVFHYGRWNYDYHYGWVWYPGNEWAPAWVEWRYSQNYIGWAPLPPGVFGARPSGIVTINFRDNYSRWNFVPFRHFTGRHLERHIVYGNRASSVYSGSKRRRNISYRNERVFNGGIERNIIEQRSGKNVRKRKINVNLSDSNQHQRKKNNPGVHQPENKKRGYPVTVKKERDNRTRKKDKTAVKARNRSKNRNHR